MKHVRITNGLLKKLDACEEHRDIFHTAFPRGITLTPEVSDAIIDKVVESTLEFDWLVGEVLSDAAHAKYAQVTDLAGDVHDRAIAPAFEEYERITHSAGAEFRQSDSGEKLAEYRRTCDSAYAEYWRVCTPFHIALQRECARAAWTFLADRNNWKPGILA